MCFATVHSINIKFFRHNSFAEIYIISSNPSAFEINLLYIVMDSVSSLLMVSFIL